MSKKLTQDKRTRNLLAAAVLVVPTVLAAAVPAITGALSGVQKRIGKKAAKGGGSKRKKRGGKSKTGNNGGRHGGES